MLRARIALEDCKRVWELLEKEEDRQIHRILWVAGVALARAVGHILDKVDRKHSPKMSKEISKAYITWKDKSNKRDSIFLEFIENNRNLVLKEYEIGYGDEDYTVLAGGATYELPGLLYCPLTDGSYAGQDCRDLLQDAIEWWEVQLNALEQHL